MKRTKAILPLVFGVMLLAGCVETPKQPVMRPIPPPPPGPPPGAAVVVYSPNPASPDAPVSAPSAVSPSPGNFEVSSNYVASGTTTNLSVVQGQGSATQGTPQYEIVPPRPGSDYVWRNGYWRWEGAWAWVPGQWEHRPPAVIFVEPGFSYHHYWGPGYGYRRHGRWR